MAFLQQILESGMMENMQPATGPYHERRPGGLYHTMVEKLAPFAMRGVIWYQGESDGDSHAKEYETVFSLLIQNWRELWNEEFPFLYVQLAPLREWMTAGGAYHVVRAAQDRIRAKLPKVWMASSGDCGMEWDIHPKDKKPVGERLALLAAGHVYGKELVCDAPEVVTAVCDKGCLKLVFAHAEGLHIEGDQIRNLAAQTEDGSVQDMTNVAIEGNSLVIRCPAKFWKIMLGQENYYEINLKNCAGIPALPFSLEISR